VCVWGGGKCDHRNADEPIGSSTMCVMYLVAYIPSIAQLFNIWACLLLLVYQTVVTNCVYVQVYSSSCRLIFLIF
jgi:hypothetical protein